VRETSLDYARPSRPMLLRALNRLPAPRRFDPEDFVGRAERAESRSFGDEVFREGLEVLCESIESEARLHATGRLITRARLLGSLRTRLRLEAAKQRDPSRFARPIPKPIVICGLPRTGTTLLHRLLAGAGLRALRTWEAVDPVPGPETPKRRSARLAEGALKLMSPDFFAVHPIDAEGVEEELLLLEPAFHSMVPPGTMRVPRYHSWFERTDATPAYRFLRDALAGLGGGERWVLKTPQHMELLETLDAVFPDALLVWTHREPREVAPSYLSLIAHGRGVLSDHVDPQEVGARWIRKLERMTTRGLEAHRALGDSRFVDVPYRALVDDPEGVALDLLERAGVHVTEAHRFGLAGARRRQPKTRHGVHRYELSRFGLDPTDVDAAFATYRERFADHL